MYADLNRKFEALNTHVKKLDIQVAQTAESLKRQEGVLPRRIYVNSRFQCSAIMLRNGEELNPILKKGLSTEEFVELEEIEEELTIEAHASIDATTQFNSGHDENHLH